MQIRTSTLSEGRRSFRLPRDQAPEASLVTTTQKGSWAPQDLLVAQHGADSFCRAAVKQSGTGPKCVPTTIEPQASTRGRWASLLAHPAGARSSEDNHGHEPAELAIAPGFRTSDIRHMRRAGCTALGAQWALGRRPHAACAWSNSRQRHLQSLSLRPAQVASPVAVPSLWTFGL